MPYRDRAAKRAYQRAWIQRRRAEFMDGQCCLRCGATNDLELHHLVKDEKVGHAIWSWARQRREDELAKCLVLCDTCHNGLHADEKRGRPRGQKVPA